MAAIQVVSGQLLSKPSLPCRRGKVVTSINAPRVSLPDPDLSGGGGGLVKELRRRRSSNYSEVISSLKTEYHRTPHNTISSDHPIPDNHQDEILIAKLYAVMEAVADRVEMHKNVGEQRDNWNHLLLTSINAMTLTAATMAGLSASITAAGPPAEAFKMSSIVLYLSATSLLAIMNKIQPSQLAEEQRNAARLFKQLHAQIQTTLSLGRPNVNDVNEAIDQVLALDKAYPLPLIGVMLEKFPSKVEPARWWPQHKGKQQGGLGQQQQAAGNIKMEGNNYINIIINGWNRKLEEEMSQVVAVVERKDLAQYIRLGNEALKLNKFLAISGPLLTFLGALGCSFLDSSSSTIHDSSSSSWPVMMGVMAGAMATVVNSIQHGCQVGMVFEMYRSTAGFFKLVEESVRLNVNEKTVERRENGEILQLKVALQLGRSPSELNHLDGETEEFASKLF